MIVLPAKNSRRQLGGFPAGRDRMRGIAEIAAESWRLARRAAVAGLLLAVCWSLPAVRGDEVVQTVEQAAAALARHLLGGLPRSPLNLAVAELDLDQPGLSAAQSVRLVDALERAIVTGDGSRRYLVKPRSDFHRMVRELWHSGLYDDAVRTLSEAARQAQAEVLVVGNVHVDRSLVRVSFKALDLRAGGAIIAVTPEIAVAAGPVMPVTEGVDWQRRAVRAKGFGAANPDFPPSTWKRSAEDAARVDAQARLVEQIDGLALYSRTFVRNYRTELDTKVREIKGRIGTTRQVGPTRFPTEDTAEVVLEATLD